MHAANHTNNVSQKTLRVIGCSTRINPNLLSFNCFLRLIMRINNNYGKFIRKPSSFCDMAKVHSNFSVHLILGRWCNGCHLFKTIIATSTFTKTSFTISKTSTNSFGYNNFFFCFSIFVDVFTVGRLDGKTFLNSVHTPQLTRKKRERADRLCPMKRVNCVRCTDMHWSDWEEL